MAMDLKRALFETGFYLKDGKIHDCGNHSEMTEDRLRKMSISSKRSVHDLYISPSTTQYNNSTVRFDKALDIVLDFVALQPTLARLGVSSSV